ncbi:MAG: hypothetical protein QM752_01930 [Gammaproteobacteria bacterium]
MAKTTQSPTSSGSNPRTPLRKLSSGLFNVDNNYSRSPLYRLAQDAVTSLLSFTPFYTPLFYCYIAHCQDQARDRNDHNFVEHLQKHKRAMKWRVIGEVTMLAGFVTTYALYQHGLQNPVLTGIAQGSGMAQFNFHSADSGALLICLCMAYMVASGKLFEFAGRSKERDSSVLAEATITLIGGTRGIAARKQIYNRRAHARLSGQNSPRVSVTESPVPETPTTSVTSPQF